MKSFNKMSLNLTNKESLQIREYSELNSQEALLSEELEMNDFGNLNFDNLLRNRFTPIQATLSNARACISSIESSIMKDPDFYQSILEIIDQNHYETIDNYSDNFLFLDLRKCIMRIKVALSEISEKVTKTNTFEIVIILIILANTAVLVLENPNTDYNSGIFYQLDLFFTYVYTIEFSLKVCARGLITNPDSYFRNYWNLLDFTIIVTSWVGLLTKGIKLNALRALRILRPLRGISSIKGIRMIFLSLFLSAEPLLDSIVILLAFLLLFAIAGLQLWMGAFRQECIDINTGLSYDICGANYCQLGQVCANTIENPEFNTISFDNILYSLLAVFQSITLEGWTYIMRYAQKSFSYFSFLYFIPIVFIGAYLILNLSIAIIATNFTKELENNSDKPRKVKTETENIISFISKKKLTEKESITNFTSADPERFGSISRQISQNKLRKLSSEILKVFENTENLEEFKNSNLLIQSGINHFANSLKWRYSSEYRDCMHNEIVMTDTVPIEINEKKHRKRTIKFTNTKEIESDSISDIKEIPFEKNTMIQNSLEIFRLRKENYEKKYEDVGNYFAIFKYFSKFSKKKICFFRIVPQVSSFISESNISTEKLYENYPNLSEINPMTSKKLYNLNFTYLIWKKNSICFAFQLFQILFKKTIENKYTTTFIISSVIANVICLTLDYYNASPSLTQAVDQANLIFTFIFASELALKLLAYGLINYSRNSMNCLDALIVSLSLIEYLLLTGKTGINAFRILRVFRIFRVLRALKIFRYLKSMNDIIIIIGRSLSDLFYLFLLLLLLSIIFTLLGMQIFAGKFNFQGSLPRTNFDTFNWAFVTIFVLLSEENWNNVLLSAMIYMPVTSLFLILWIIIGNYVLLSLILAILLKGFESIDDTEEILDIYEQNFFFQTYAKEVRKKKIKELEKLKEEEEEEMDNAMEISDLESILQKKNRDLTEKLFEGIECEKSFLFFSKTSRLRIFLFGVTVNPKFEAFILILIIGSTIKLACDTYILNYPESSKEVLISYYLDLGFTILFSFESLIKSISNGFIKDQGSYLRDLWGVLDFLIVLLSILDLCLSNIKLPMIKVFRLLRTFRPLRLITHNLSMKVVVSALISSMIAIMNILGIIILIWLVFAILGVSLLKGKMYSCSDPQYNFETDCLAAGYTWVNSFYNFDNVLEALVTLFTISSQEAWPDRMYEGVDAVDIGTAPITNYNPGISYFFIIYLIIGNFFLVNLFAAVVFDKFNTARKSEESLESCLLTRDQLNWLELQKLIVKSGPGYTFNKRRNKFRCNRMEKIVTNKYFDMAMLGFIILNTISMSIIYQDAPRNYVAKLDFINYLCTYVFIFEAVLKIIGFGVDYFKNYWNVFDFFVVLCSILNIILDYIIMSNLNLLRIVPQIIRIIRVLRISRMFKVIKSLRSIQIMTDIILFSLPAVFNVLSIMMLVFFMYAILGSYLFYTVQSGLIISDYFNFKNFHNSMMILWRISTGEDYPYIMQDCVTQLNSKSYILYFTSFVTLTTFIFSDLFVSVIIQNYQEYEENPESAAFIFNNVIASFNGIWNSYTGQWKGLRMSHKELPNFMYALGPDLGAANGLPLNKVVRMVAAMDLEVDSKGYVYYNDMLFAVMKRKYEKKLINTKDVLVKKLMRKEEMKAYKSLAKLRLFAMKKMSQKSRIGDRKISHVRVYINLKKIFNAWKRFRDEKMGRFSAENSIQVIDIP